MNVDEVINQSLGCWSSAGNLRCDDVCYIPIKLEVAISIDYQDSVWFFVHLNERWLEQLLKSSEISQKLSFLKESQLLIYKSYDELEVWWFTIEGLGWDSLLTMFHNPGGAWHPGGVVPTYTSRIWHIFVEHVIQPFGESLPCAKSVVTVPGQRATWELLLPKWTTTIG